MTFNNGTACVFCWLRLQLKQRNKGLPCMSIIFVVRVYVCNCVHAANETAASEVQPQQYRKGIYNVTIRAVVRSIASS